MSLTKEQIKQIKQNDHIPTDVIEEDIKITKQEIDRFEKQLDMLTNDRKGNRVEIYMREGKILKRKDFINNLESILNYRKEYTK